MTLDEDLQRWQAAGLLDAGQAAGIRDFEAARGGLTAPGTAAAEPAPPPQPGLITRLEVSLTEVVAYAGSIAVLVGLGFLLGFQGEQLGDTGRLAVYVLVTAAAFGVGLLFEPRSDRPPIRRARASALLLAVAATFALAAEAFTDLHLLTQPARFTGLGPDQSGNLMLAGVVAAAVAAPLYWRYRALLLGLATAAAAYAAAGNFVSWRNGGDPWPSLAVYCAAGLFLLAAVELVRARGAGRWAVELPAFLAFAPPALAAFALAPSDDGSTWFLLAGGALATLASGAAVARHSPGYGIAAGLGLTAYVAAVPGHFFGRPWALLLLLGGSAVVLAHSERLRRIGRTGGAMEFYRCAAVVALTLPGIALLPFSDPAATLPLAILGLLAAAASGAAVVMRSPGFAVGAGIGLAVFVVASPAFLSTQPWLAALYIGGASAVVVAHVERFRVTQRRAGWVEWIAFAGLMTPIGFGLSLAAGPSQIAFEALAGAIAVAAFGAAVIRSSRGYAVAGGIGLFDFTLTVGFRHFTGSIGFAGVMVASGLVLIGIAFALARLLPRLRKRTEPAPV